MLEARVFRKYPFRKLWRLAHALAQQNNIDLSQGEPAYLRLLKFVPADELPFWPRDLRIYNVRKERYNSSFFTAPVQHFKKYQRLEGGSLRKKVTELKRSLAKSERERRDESEKQAKLIDFLKDRVAALLKKCSASEKKNLAESENELGRLREKLAARDAELALAKEAAINFEDEIGSLREKIESLREKIWAQEQELAYLRKTRGDIQPAKTSEEAVEKKMKRSRGANSPNDLVHFGGSVKGVCYDILDLKDLATLALREKAMEERREIYVKVGNRWYYSHAFYLRLVTCNSVKSNQQYDELLSRIKNEDVRRMYPSSADFNNVYRFPSRSCEMMSRAA